jgi:hypothetical protein
LHDDVGADPVGLNLDRALGGEHVAAAVDVAREGDRLLRHFRDVGQRHDLEAARVGEDRPAPAHEPMQPAQPGQPLGPGPQHQMVGVAQDDVSAGLPDLLDGQRLNRSRGADRHERRRTHLAPERAQDAGAGGAVGCGDLEGKGGHQSARTSKEASP